jgi:hypothetical protein
VTGSLEFSDTSQICPRFTKTTLERSGSPQLGPWGKPPAVLAGFRRGGGRGRWGEGGGTTGDSPRLHLGAWLGKKRLPAGWTAAPDGGGRWSSCSGEAAARRSTRARRRATARVGEGGGHYSWGTRPVEPGVATAVLTSAGRAARAGTAGTRELPGGAPFYRRRARTRAADGPVVRCGGRPTRGARRVAGGDSETPRCACGFGKRGASGGVTSGGGPGLRRRGRARPGARASDAAQVHAA